jgi:hypothetical protein
VTSALATRVADALSDLDEQERFALEARERSGEDYALIAQKLATGREGVADLLVSARLAVRAHVRDVPAPPRRTPQCGPARRVMTAQQDGERLHPEDLERLREHLADCVPCREARLALREASLACSAWRRIPPSELAVREPEPRRRARPRDTVAEGRRRLAVAVAGLLVLLVILIAALGGDGGGTPAPVPPEPGPGSAQGSGEDVVPPPGDAFCAEGEPDCP